MITLKEYQGHIRNWRELCDTLEVDPYLPRADREAAIMLAAYQTWGKEMGNHIYGMFSLAIYDEKANTLFCLRDQFGTKPFYYYLTEEGNILYSASIRTLMAQDGFVKELNKDMLQLYLSLTYVAGEDTFFKGVKKLMPGHSLTWVNGDLTIDQYWAPSFKPDTSKSLDEWADAIHETLATIMTEVKEEDETAASFLSGGVDSSYILAVSDAQTANSCGYEEERFDESRIAKVTADLLDRQHQTRIIQPEEYFAAVPEAMYHMEQPLGDASAIVFALGCEATAQHTQLVYSGEGSDEFFGGYNIYRNAERYGDNLKDFYVGNTNIMKEDEKQALLKYYNPELLPIDLVKDLYQEMEGWDPLTKMLNVDIQVWLEGDIYLNIDKMSQRYGLEVRMPLTDIRMFNLAAQIPNHHKIDSQQNKLALRKAAAKVLPEEIAYRKKLGFIVPIRIWMADDRYNQAVRQQFNSPAAEQFFNLAEINQIFDDYVAGDSDLWRKVWTIYTFLVWYDEYFVKR